VLPQTRTAIERLLACGLERKDFSVNVHRRFINANGTRHVEYGDVSICLHMPVEKSISFAERLAEHFSVSIGYDGDTPIVIIVREPGIEYDRGYTFHWKKGIEKWQLSK